MGEFVQTSLCCEPYSYNLCILTPLLHNIHRTTMGCSLPQQNFAITGGTCAVAIAGDTVNQSVSQILMSLHKNS